MRDADMAVVSTLNAAEATPLGDAEWIEFFSLFFNAEVDGAAIFAEVSDRSLVAGLSFSRVFSIGRIPKLTPGSLLAAGLIVAAMSVNSSWLIAIALVGSFSLSITITIMVGITYHQMAAPDSIRSSVNVIGRMVAWGGQPFGAALGAVLAAGFDVQFAYTVAAGVMAVTAVVAFLALRGAQPRPMTPH